MLSIPWTGASTSTISAAQGCGNWRPTSKVEAKNVFGFVVNKTANDSSSSLQRRREGPGRDIRLLGSPSQSHRCRVSGGFDHGAILDDRGASEDRPRGAGHRSRRKSLGGGEVSD